jgi:hypothetical protein
VTGPLPPETRAPETGKANLKRAMRRMASLATKALRGMPVLALLLSHGGPSSPAGPAGNRPCFLTSRWISSRGARPPAGRPLEDLGS